MKTLYCINPQHIARGEIKAAEVVKETDKTYIVRIEDEPNYERTIRKSDMTHGIYNIRFFETYADALIWLKDRAEETIIGNSEAIYCMTLENNSLRELIEKITAQQSDAGENIKEVCIPACEDHEGYKTVKIKLRWVCPVCGQPRGTITNVRSYDGSLCVCCDGWKNPCGHTDKYAVVRQEAKTNGLNPTYASEEYDKIAKLNELCEKSVLIKFNDGTDAAGFLHKQTVFLGGKPRLDIFFVNTPLGRIRIRLSNVASVEEA